MAGNDASKMSAEAQELIKLTSSKSQWGGGDSLDATVDVGALLEKRPELMKGMKEYLAWRDEENRAIAETKKPAMLGHEMSKLTAKLPKKGKKGK